MDTPITLTIDGKEVRTRDGELLIRVIREAGIDVPSLCRSRGPDDPEEAGAGDESLPPPPPGMAQPGGAGPQGPLQLQPYPAPFQGTSDADAQPTPPQQPLMLPRPGIVPLPQTSPQPGTYPMTPPGTQSVPGTTSAVPGAGATPKPPPEKPGGEP